MKDTAAALPVTVKSSLSESRETFDSRRIIKKMRRKRKVDRISGLPDDIRCHILSFLTTKSAAATSILSPRWLYLFASVPDFQLHYGHGFDCEDESVQCARFSKFINFGRRVIHLRNGAPFMNLQFSTFLKGFGLRETAESLLFALIECGVQKLDLSMIISSVPSGYSSFYPKNIFSSDTLVDLTISSPIDLVDVIRPRSDNYLCFLPKLKVLRLQFLKLSDELSIQRLIQGSPLLQELDIFVDYVDPGSVLEISTDSLKKLQLRFPFYEYSTVLLNSTSLESFRYRYCANKKFVLNTPNLRYFECRSHIGEGMISLVGNLDLLVEARLSSRPRISHILTEIDNLRLPASHFLQFVRWTQSVKTLVISEWILKVLFECGYMLPTFNNLTNLEIGGVHQSHSDCTLSWKTLFTFLEYVPNLQVLVLDAICYGHIQREKIQPLFRPDAIATCFSQHLFRYFNNLEYEFQLIEHFLQCGKALEKMTIHGCFDTDEFPSESCSRILSFNRCSKNCQVLLKRRIKW